MTSSKGLSRTSAMIADPGITLGPNETDKVRSGRGILALLGAAGS